MTAEERAVGFVEWLRDKPHVLADEKALAEGIELLIIAAVQDERDACARIAERQPFYPDTHTGMRQQWVKEQIAAAIRARGEG